jgi:hypothetical protein
VRAIEQIVKTGADGTKTVVGWKESVDPKKFARSSDAYRRHLTPEQKRAVIADDIKEDPHASDLKIARERNVSPTPWRKSAPDKGYQICKMQIWYTSPSKGRGRCSIENPGLSIDELAARADISRGTAQRALKTVGNVSPGTGAENRSGHATGASRPARRRVGL